MASWWQRRWIQASLKKSSIRNIPKRRPFLFAVGFGGAKNVAADLLVQQWVEGSEEIDWRRLTVFLCFGLGQVGAVQYTLYCGLYSRWFPSAAAFAAKSIPQKLRDGPGMLALLKQLCIDQFIYHPICYFPVFYTCKELVTGEADGLGSTFSTAVDKYRVNATEDLFALWKIWIPVLTIVKLALPCRVTVPIISWMIEHACFCAQVSLVNFAFTPMHLRVPLVATVGFGWCAYLSYTRGASSLARTADECV